MSTTERTTPTISWTVYESPLGPLTLAAGPRGVTHLWFPGRAGSLDERDHDRDRDTATLAGAVAQLEAYFAGERRTFDLPLDLAGTPFQQQVWAHLRQIPFGTTIAYSQLAQRLGRPDVVRAVGAAVGRTPVPIIVPCHRVVAVDGALTGYGGGLHRKQALLGLERRAVGDHGPTRPPTHPPPAWAFRQLALL
jgi:methylated-DNA-[protein]-cysteine S-methyltransferase